MQSLTPRIGLALCALLCCLLPLLEAAPFQGFKSASQELRELPPGSVPGVPVSYKRFVRRRPSTANSQLDVYEVRYVYYIRRKPTKPPRHLTDAEMERRIRCDFEPTLAECGRSPISTTRTTGTTTTTTRMPISTSTTSTEKPTTYFPYLPELPNLSESEQSDPEPEPEPTTPTPADDDDFILDETDTPDTDGTDTLTEEEEAEQREDDLYGQVGSIGDRDPNEQSE